ncbi:MAG: DUF6462 family protein [Clostridiales bacterium]|nr:DUF6462 family protein [Clostridiales bacterium]
MNENKARIPVWEKYVLSIPEAAEYFHINDKKLRQLISQNAKADFVLHNGTHVLIKRKLFEKYIDEQLREI